MIMEHEFLELYYSFVEGHGLLQQDPLNKVSTYFLLN